MQQLETKRQHAKERVEAIRGFYIHALITIPVGGTQDQRADG